MRAIALAVLLGLTGVESAIKKVYGLPAFGDKKEEQYVLAFISVVFLICLVLGI